MKLRLWAIAMTIALLSVAFSGCSNETKTVFAKADAKPDSRLPGFYSMDQSLRGGKTLRGQNLRDIRVTQEDGDYVMEMEFVQGSMAMGLQETPSVGVPEYSIHCLGGLNRMVIEISGLTFWDYKLYDNEIKNTPIEGSVCQVPTDTEITKLYINMKDQFAYKAEEQGNKIRIYFRTMNLPDTSRWYAVLNAYEEYSQGDLSEDLGFTPSLCSDKTNATLISPPFDTQDEAYAFVDQQQGTVGQQAPDAAMMVMQIASSQLPDFGEYDVLDSFASQPVGYLDNQTQTMPAFLTNGRLLAWKPDSNNYVFAKPFFLKNKDYEAVSYEKLYVGNTDDGVSEVITDYEFGSIQLASFSKDGRYLAFTDQNENNCALYIYDFTSKKLYAPSEENAWDYTAEFAWGDDNKSLYSISGDRESLRLMVTTVGGDGTIQTTELPDMDMSDSDMGFYDGCIYFMQYDQEGVNATIYKIPASDFQQDPVKVADGIGFQIHEATGKMAILQDKGDGGNYALTILDLTSGEQKNIVSSADINEMCWSVNGGELYYSVFRDSGSDARYPMGLYVYDGGEPRYIMDIVTGSLKSFNQEGSVLLMHVFSHNDGFIPIMFQVTVP